MRIPAFMRPRWLSLARLCSCWPPTPTHCTHPEIWRALHGKGYLLWLRGGTLVAQDFDADTLKLSGVPHPVADPVARMGAHGQMQVAVSATGILLYSSSNPLRQFMWVDRTGKPQGTVGEPALNAFFHLSPDGRRVAVTRVNSCGSRSLDAGCGPRCCEPVHFPAGY